MLLFSRQLMFKYSQLSAIIDRLQILAKNNLDSDTKKIKGAPKKETSAKGFIAYVGLPDLHALRHDIYIESQVDHTSGSGGGGGGGVTGFELPPPP